MEVGPVIQRQEEVPQPDLLEVFADKEITIFGIKGKFRDLAAICPVDLTDKSISTESKNEFVVKAANEAGLEIEPKYEAVFTHYAEKLGLERKFSVAERDVQPQDVNSQDVRPQDVRPRDVQPVEEIAEGTRPIEFRAEVNPAAPEASHSELEAKHLVAANLEQQQRMAEVVLTRVAEKSDSRRPLIAKVKDKPISESAPPAIAPKDKGQSVHQEVTKKVARKAPAASKIEAPLKRVEHTEPLKRVERTEKSERVTTSVVATNPESNPETNSDAFIETPVRQVPPAENVTTPESGIEPEVITEVEQSSAINDDLMPDEQQSATTELAELSELEDPEDFSLLEADDTVLIMAAIERGQVLFDDSEAEALDLDTKDEEAEPFLFRIIEEGNLVAVPELPAPIEQIETAITTLSEVIATTADESLERIDQVIKDIISLPEKLDALELSTDQKEIMIEEKIEALFIELFDEAGIEYTPQLIKSFVLLTREHYLDELLLAAKVEDEEPSGIPDELGTREFLQKLQHGLSVMKRAAIHLYEIGKSILRLYSMNKALHG